MENILAGQDAPVVHPEDNVWFKILRQIAQKYDPIGYVDLLYNLKSWWFEKYGINPQWPNQ